MPIMTYIQAISDGMREEMRRDPKVMVMGEDVGVYGGAFKVTKGFIDEFGADRVYDTPLSESAIMGCGLGMAITGLRPIVEFQFADLSHPDLIRSLTMQVRCTFVPEIMFQHRLQFVAHQEQVFTVDRFTHRALKHGLSTLQD